MIRRQKIGNVILGNIIQQSARADELPLSLYRILPTAFFWMFA